MGVTRYGRALLADGTTPWIELDGARAELLSAAPWAGGRRIGAVLGEPRPRRVPVAPSKIVCVGRNYRAHAAELGHDVPEEPLLFLKPPSSLLDPGRDLELPPPALARQIEHEIELGVVIGTRLFRGDADAAARAILGYAVVADVTARDLQKTDKQWTRAKGLDGFCPVGPEIVCGIDASALTLRCWVDGELRQQGSTAEMVFGPAALVAFISQAMTLEPGDLVLTGTPAGVGPLCAGNTLRMEIDGIAPLELSVRGSSQ